MDRRLVTVRRTATTTTATLAVAAAVVLQLHLQPSLLHHLVEQWVEQWVAASLHRHLAPCRLLSLVATSRRRRPAPCPSSWQAATCPHHHRDLRPFLSLVCQYRRRHRAPASLSLFLSPVAPCPHLHRGRSSLWLPAAQCLPLLPATLLALECRRLHHADESHVTPYDKHSRPINQLLLNVALCRRRAVMRARRVARLPSAALLSLLLCAAVCGAVGWDMFWPRRDQRAWRSPNAAVARRGLLPLPTARPTLPRSFMTCFNLLLRT
jgi:hypothetical protein